MNRGWRLGSDRGNSDPTGPPRVLVAEIATSGAMRHAPRVLRLWAAGPNLAVRDDAGRLVWLETGHFSAFPSTTDGIQVAPADADGDGALVPEDTAPEAQAMLSLSNLASWADAQVDPAAPVDGNGTRRARLVTTDGRDLTAVVDTETGVVISVEGQSLRGAFLIEMTSRRYVPWDPDLFEPR